MDDLIQPFKDRNIFAFWFVLLNMNSNQFRVLKLSKHLKEVPFEIDPHWCVSRERISMS